MLAVNRSDRRSSNNHNKRLESEPSGVEQQHYAQGGLPVIWLQEQSRILDQQRQTIRLLVAMLVTLLVLSALVLWMPSQNALTPEREAQVMAEAVPLSSIKNDYGALQQKITSLLNKSIQIKLKSLESRLADGHLSPAELQMLQDLREELGTLEQAYALLQEAGYTPVNVQGLRIEPPYRRALNNDVENLKSIFVVSMASISVMVTVLGGYLYHSTQRLKQVEAKLEKMIFLSDLSS